MFKKLALASLIALVFTNLHAQITVDTSATTTGGAITSSPLSSSVSTTGSSASTVGSLTTGASTSSVGALSTGASSSTSAGGGGGLGGAGGVSTSSTGSSTATIGALSTGASTSAGGAGGLGGAATSAGGKSSSSGNTSGNTTVTSNYAAAILPKIPVATAYAPANLPTAPCMGATSVGVSAVLFGFSTGSSWEATECMTLEMARSFQQGGHDDDAQAVRCSSKYAENAPSCVRLKQLKEFQGQRAQLMQDDRPKSGKVNIVSGAYLETIDSVTGFKTVVDTRDSYRR